MSISQIGTQGNLLALITDGIHTYDDPVDKWVVIVGGEEVAWAEDYGTAERSYEEMLRVEREHVTRNPDNAIPISGIAPDDSGDESSEQARLGLPVEW